MTGDFRDQFTAVLPFHEKSFAEPPFKLLDGCNSRYAPSSSSGNVAEGVQVQLPVAPTILMVLIDKEVAIGVCKKLLAADRFACLLLL